MKGSKRRLVIETIVLTIAAIVVIVILGGLAVIYSGLPNVAATSPHTALVAWVLSTTADRSVEAAARNIKLPADYNELDMHAGFHSYDRMCVGCHGAAGVDRRWLGKGLYPEPPSLYLSVKDMSPEEVFWIIKHAEIWQITALVKKLPEMSPEQYKTLAPPEAQPTQ
jgi:mono/diheme cytochrome c family protein